MHLVMPVLKRVQNLGPSSKSDLWKCYANCNTQKYIFKENGDLIQKEPEEDQTALDQTWRYVDQIENAVNPVRPMIRANSYSPYAILLIVIWTWPNSKCDSMNSCRYIPVYILQVYSVNTAHCYFKSQFL